MKIGSIEFWVSYRDQQGAIAWALPELWLAKLHDLTPPSLTPDPHTQD